MKYLTILLDDTSVPFCHADNPHKIRKLIPLDILKKGIVFAMKENLSIQFIYPEYSLPSEYVEMINTMDHIDIKPAKHTLSSDIVVINEINKLYIYVNQADFDSVYVIRCKLNDLYAYEADICKAVKVLNRVNIIVIDIHNFSDSEIEHYNRFLDNLSKIVCDKYNSGSNPQINLLTDRLFLDSPNHCNSGVDSITLSTNGKFYICPAFYYDEYNNKGKNFDIGSIDIGINCKNSHLLKLEYAPICRICDAYHCKRCLWLNKNLTHELNTPSRQQCIMSHMERDHGRLIESSIIPNSYMTNIPKIDYMDPFELLTNKSQ